MKIVELYHNIKYILCIYEILIKSVHIMQLTRGAKLLLINYNTDNSLNYILNIYIT